jgi:hypothetical protein
VIIEKFLGGWFELICPGRIFELTGRTNVIAKGCQMHTDLLEAGLRHMDPADYVNAWLNPRIARFVYKEEFLPLSIYRHRQILSRRQEEDGRRRVRIASKGSNPVLGDSDF